MSNAMTARARASATPTMITMEPRLNNDVMRFQIGVETRRRRAWRTRATRLMSVDAVMCDSLSSDVARELVLVNRVRNADGVSQMKVFT